MQQGRSSIVDLAVESDARAEDVAERILACAIRRDACGACGRRSPGSSRRRRTLPDNRTEAPPRRNAPGIRKSLGASHETKDDLDAVQLAMQPGITGKTSRHGGTGNKAGAGLFLSKAMAHTSRNYMVVHSGSGLFKLKVARSDDDALRLYSNPAHDHATRYSKMPAWPGTMVGIDLDVSNFVEFKAVLNFIRTSYNVDVKSADRGKTKKQPRFK